MKLIFGLGNPGRDYILTRHNLGYLVVSSLAKKFNKDFKKDGFTQSQIVKLHLANNICFLAKPTTFMNLCGKSIKRLVDRYDFLLKDILVVCDDVNLELGRIKIRPQGEAGGHNGLESIIESLGAKDFARLRIGISRPKTQKDLAGYVLEKFARNESLAVKPTIEKGVQCCEYWAGFGIDAAMNKFNPSVSKKS